MRLPTLLQLVASVSALLNPQPNTEHLEDVLSPRKGLAFMREDLTFQEQAAGTMLNAGQEALVPVVLAVMSKCPDAQLCEGVFDKVASQAGAKMDLSLVYIGSINSSATYGVDCKHGDSECKGNIQQLCYRRTYPRFDDWWNFVQCQNYADLSKIGEDSLAQSCAKVRGGDWNLVQECIDKRGSKLLQASVRTAEHMGATASCSIYINGQLVCIHDNVWRNCDGGHQVVDFVREVESEYDRLNRDTDEP